jgi:hypothetical protein
MSDKFLVESAPAKTTQQTYLDRRRAAQKKHLESQPKSLKLREEEKRRKGLGTSLFAGVEGGADSAKAGEGSGGPAASNKAMSMMMKMGWKVGEGLGRKGEDTNEPTDPRKGGDESEPSEVQADEDEGGEPSARAGIGMARKRRRSTEPDNTEAPSFTKQRVEPLRVSMWAGRFPRPLAYRQNASLKTFLPSLRQNRSWSSQTLSFPRSRSGRTTSRETSSTGIHHRRLSKTPVWSQRSEKDRG